MNWNAFKNTLGIGGVIIAILAILILIPLVTMSWLLGLTLFNTFLVCAAALVMHGAGLAFHGLGKWRKWEAGHTISRILLFFPWWAAISWVGLVVYSRTLGLNFESDYGFLLAWLGIVGGLLAAFGLSYKGISKTPPKSELLGGILLAMFVIAVAQGLHAVSHPFSYNPAANVNGQEVGEFPYKWSIPWQLRLDDGGNVITDPSQLTSQHVGPGAYLVRVDVTESADNGAYFVAWDETSRRQLAARDCIRQIHRQQLTNVKVPKDCDLENGYLENPELTPVQGTTEKLGFFALLRQRLMGGGGAILAVFGLLGLGFGQLIRGTIGERIASFLVAEALGAIMVMVLSFAFYGNATELVAAPAQLPVVVQLSPGEEVEVGLIDLFTHGAEGEFENRVVVQVCGNATMPNAKFELTSRQADSGTGSMRVLRLNSVGVPKAPVEPLIEGSVGLLQHNPAVPSGARTVYLRSTQSSTAPGTFVVGTPRQVIEQCGNNSPLPGIRSKFHDEALRCLLGEAPNTTITPPSQGAWEGYCARLRLF